MLSRHSLVAPKGLSTRTISRPMRLVVVAGTPVSSNDFKNGLAIELDNVPYKVTEFLHVKPGKGSAFVRSKLKNCLNGSVIEKTFRAGEMVDSADLMRREAQYTYPDGDDLVFMDQESFEETRVVRDKEWAGFLAEGAIVSLLFYNGKVISVEPPINVELIVADCPPNVKGNTASGGGSKPAVMETGAVVMVPLFIDIGQRITVDTRTGSYLGKAK